MTINLRCVVTVMKKAYNVIYTVSLHLPVATSVPLNLLAALHYSGAALILFIVSIQRQHDGRLLRLFLVLYMGRRSVVRYDGRLLYVLAWHWWRSAFMVTAGCTRSSGDNASSLRIRQRLLSSSKGRGRHASVSNLSSTHLCNNCFSCSGCFSYLPV